jgi:hypothetical protein
MADKLEITNLLEWLEKILCNGFQQCEISRSLEIGVVEGTACSLVFLR